MDVDTNGAQKMDSFVIKATDAPRDFFDNRDAAKRYFRRFGKVKLVMFKPKKNCLLVEYANEDSMLNALEVGGEYNGQVFNVTRDTQVIPKRKKNKKDADPDWTADPEVRSELEAMGAFGPPRAYDLRSEAMSVDAPETKAKQRRWKGAAGSPKPLKKKGKEVVRDNYCSGEQSDLAQIIRQQALSVEDKFRILDARDKLIRINLKKNIELARARATVGNCPDMCPEKERLMRETQHQVALYEQEEGGRGMNPRLAVKQYSRSSADQEAPLPQELRPVGVLQMTMGYLMHRIMGLCETPDVNIAEWYHFLWDRTRGIRKDITQQELCCQGSVELVEQCARFHIFCSARLVAEDPSVFDQKINTENLTKCLQTLKYMYHDLQLKGESCVNEAEFRAYIILLNLNDGNFMWEVQQLKPSIQLSPAVKFALAVHSSLDKNNYVKFFKLVNATTFLNACILMRYFTQVRISALKTLLKSYSPRVSQSSLPVAHLAKVLGFESPDSAIDFCESHGLYTDVERSRVVLDKANFAPPEYPYILDRAVHLVESKRSLSVGEVVCGKPLPPRLYETHTPQDSFDEDGYLCHAPDVTDGPDARLDEPMDAAEAPEPRPPIADEPTPPIAAEPSPPIAAEQPLVAATPTIFRPVETTPFVPIAETTSLWSQPTIFGNAGVTSIFGWKERNEEEETRLEEERRRAEREEAERRRLQEEERRRRLEEEEQRRLEEERRLIAMRKKLIEEQQKRREHEIMRKNVEIKAAVCDAISGLLDAVEENMRHERLEEIARRITDRRVRRAAAKWRESARRRRKRKALDFEATWLAKRTVREEAEELRMSGQNLALQSMKRYKRGKPYEVHVKEDEVMAKIDLCDLTYKLLRKKFMEVDVKMRSELFWKVTVSLPDDTEFGSGLNHLENVFDEYIKWEKRGSTTATIEQSKSLPTITYCLEKQKGSVVNPHNATSGFVFVADDVNDDLRMRIHRNFRTFGACVRIPAVLVLQSYTEHKLDLPDAISDYLILVDRFTPKNLVNLLEEALIFLSTRAPKSPPLELDTLRSFLTKHLCTEPWRRANSFAKWNSNYKACLRSPHTAIYLYNEALARLKRLLLDERRRQHAAFPAIFKEFLRSQIPDSLPCDYRYFPGFWGHPAYEHRLEAALDALRLPNFVEAWPPGDARQLEAAIAAYCAAAVPRARGCFYRTMAAALRGGGAEAAWTELVALLGAAKLEQADLSLYGTGFVNQSVFNQLVAVYDVEELNEYARSDWFYVGNPVVKQKVAQMLEGEGRVRAEEEGEEGEVDLDAILEGLRRPREVNVGRIKADVSSCRRLLGDLEESVVVHRRILEKSKSFLKTVIEES